MFEEVLCKQLVIFCTSDGDVGGGGDDNGFDQVSWFSITLSQLERKVGGFSDYSSSFSSLWVVVHFLGLYSLCIANHRERWQFFSQLCGDNNATKSWLLHWLYRREVDKFSFSIFYTTSAPQATQLMKLKILLYFIVYR